MNASDDDDETNEYEQQSCGDNQRLYQKASSHRHQQPQPELAFSTHRYLLVKKKYNSSGADTNDDFDDDDDANEEADDVVDEAEYGDGDGARLVAAVGLRLPLLAFAPNLVGATSRVVPLKLLLRAVVVVVVVFVDAGTVR